MESEPNNIPESEPGPEAEPVPEPPITEIPSLIDEPHSEEELALIASLRISDLTPPKKDVPLSADDCLTSELFLINDLTGWLLVHQRKNGRLTCCRGTLSDPYTVTTRHEIVSDDQYAKWASSEYSLMHSSGLSRALDVTDVGPLLEQLIELGIIVPGQHVI